MKQDRWIDHETAVELLRKICNFLTHDHSGIADFKILDGREAILISMYTGAFFIQDLNHKVKFRTASQVTESLMLVPFENNNSGVIIPILSRSLSEYLEFFPDILGPKYFFMVDMSKYYPPSYFKANTTIYSKYYYASIMERLSKEILENVTKAGLQPSDCLVWPSGADGVYGEDFWCYVAGVVLRDKGYFISDYNLGGGDLSAYFIPEYITTLQSSGLMNKGCFIEELEMLRLKDKSPEKIQMKNYETILIEAESTELRTKSGGEGAGIGQVENYLLNTGYNKAFVAGPYCSEDNVKYHDMVGLISCDEEGNLIFVEKEPFREANPNDIRLIKEVIKCSLLKNLNIEHWFKLCQTILGHKPESLSEYFSALLKADLETVVKEIKLLYTTRTSYTGCR